MAVRPLPTPSTPSAQEVREHELTHLPYRAWCPHCVRGRGKSMDHRVLDAETSHSVPHVSMDYSFLGQDDQKSMPVALIRDHASRTTFSHVVPCKGVEGSTMRTSTRGVLRCTAPRARPDGAPDVVQQRIRRPIMSPFEMPWMSPGDSEIRMLAEASAPWYFFSVKP